MLCKTKLLPESTVARNWPWPCFDSVPPFRHNQNQQHTCHRSTQFWQACSLPPTSSGSMSRRRVYFCIFTQIDSAELTLRLLWNTLTCKANNRICIKSLGYYYDGIILMWCDYAVRDAVGHWSIMSLNYKCNAKQPDGIQHNITFILLKNIPWLNGFRLCNCFV